jgi:hypothetical protein
VHKYKWFALQGELDQARISYKYVHQQLMRDGFGSGYHFEMKRFELNIG